MEVWHVKHTMNRLSRQLDVSGALASYSMTLTRERVLRVDYLRLLALEENDPILFVTGKL